MTSNADLEKINTGAPVRSKVSDTPLKNMPVGVDDPKTIKEKNENEGKKGNKG